MDKIDVDQFLMTLSDPVNGAGLVPGMPYEDVLEKLGRRGGKRAVDVLASMMEFRVRERFVGRFGFSILTHEEVDALSGLVREAPVFEVGAGSGYLSALLSARGVDVTASDNGGWRHHAEPGVAFQRRDHEGDSLVMMGPHWGSVVMSWPPLDEPFAYHVAQAMEPGQVLFYLGEGQSGCTADDAFFEELGDRSRWGLMGEATKSLNKWHLQFSGIHDLWSVFRKLA